MGENNDGLRGALEFVKENVGPKTVVVDGKVFSDQILTPVRDIPRPNPIEGHTLQSLVDYLIENPDGINISDIFIHVVSYDKVEVLSKFLEADGKRTTFFRSTVIDKIDFSFGKWYNMEEFIINLQACFVQNQASADMLKVISTISKKDGIDVTDNGVSLEVATKSGTNLADGFTIKNPMTLAPYRTFRELEQPSGQFIFRLNSSVQMSLFESGSGEWKLEAIKKIKIALEGELDNITILA